MALESLHKVFVTDLPNRTCFDHLKHKCQPIANNRSTFINENQQLLPVLCSNRLPGPVNAGSLPVHYSEPHKPRSPFHLVHFTGSYTVGSNVAIHEVNRDEKFLAQSTHYIGLATYILVWGFFPSKLD